MSLGGKDLTAAGSQGPLLGEQRMPFEGKSDILAPSLQGKRHSAEPRDRCGQVQTWGGEDAWSELW